MITQTFEEAITEKALTAPRITPDHVESVIVGEKYVVLPSGKGVLCELTLKNGYTVHGIAPVVSKVNFSEEIGRRVSREKAVKEIWPLEGYLLQQKLFDATLTEQIAAYLEAHTVTPE